MTDVTEQWTFDDKLPDETIEEFLQREYDSHPQAMRDQAEIIAKDRWRLLYIFKKNRLSDWDDTSEGQRRYLLREALSGIKALDAAGLTISRKGEDAPAKREAARLAMSLWRKHYREDSPNFELLDTTAGIITQIDNMTANLRRPVPPPPTDKRPDLLHDGATDDPNNKDCNITPGEARFAGKPDALREALEEAVKQIEYLHEKFQETGTGNAIIARARTALANTDGGWRDIESAPRDGTEFFAWVIPGSEKSTARPERLVCRVKGGAFEYKHSHGWFRFRGEKYLAQKLTHWRPLPTPPTEAE